MSDLYEAIFPRREAFSRALLHLVNLAEQRGVSVRVADFRAALQVGEFELTYELQAFGRTVIRRWRRGRLEASLDCYDVEQGLDLFERYLQEIEH